MKQSLVLAGCVVILSMLFGCQKTNTGTGLNTDRRVDVTVKGGGSFPKSLVGRWKDQEKGWEFVFRPDGTISSAVIDSGMIRVKPGTPLATKVLKNGGKAVYKLGKWTVQYTPEKRELSVQVVVEHFQIGRGPESLEGKSTDWFIGPVSADSKTWKADWFTFPKYKGMNTLFDPNDNPIDTLVFGKQR